MADIIRLFDQAINAAQDRLKRRGLVARLNASGPPTIEVPGSNGRLIYVRLGSGADGVIEAIPKGVPKRAHVYVLCHKEDGQWVAELDTGAINQNGSGSNAAPPHTHRRGSGLEFIFQPELFAPGVVLPSSGLTVSIGSFRYPNNGNGETYAGGTLDLTSNLPATAGKWAWILVALNPANNTPIAVTGAEFDTQAELTIAEIDNIAAASYIPLAAIQANQADTALTDHSRYYDAKAWVPSPLAQGALNDLSDVTLGVLPLAANHMLIYDGIRWANTPERRTRVGYGATYIFSGEIDVSVGAINIRGLIDVFGEGDVDDELNTISGGNTGEFIALFSLDSSLHGAITLVGTGNINIDTPIVLDDPSVIVHLFYSGGVWHLINPSSLEGYSPPADYALLPGRAGGQTLIGGAGDGDSLRLESTSHANKGQIVASDEILASNGIVFGDETLSVYDEGPWTPALTGSGSNPTVAYTTQEGTYTQIGNRCHFSLRIVINTISGGSGNALVSMPLTAAATPGLFVAPMRSGGVDLPGTPVGLILAIAGGTALANLTSVQDNAAPQNVPVSGFSDGDSFIVSGVYAV